MVRPRTTFVVARVLLRDSAEGVIIVLAFDVADLRKHGITIAPLPDERGRFIDVRTLPAAFAQRLQQSGLDTAKPVRIVGVIARRPNGEPGPYLVRFEQG